MLLTPHELDRLLIFQAASLARSRQARGLLLNAPEAIAIIADTACEAARDGLTLPEAIERATRVLDAQDVLPGVTSLVPHVEVEALFMDGMRLLMIPEPLGPSQADGPGAVSSAPLRPAAPADCVDVEVTNTAAVPIAITSHWHFFEANRRLSFDRAASWGRRLSIPTGSTIRWAAGESHVVRLVPFRGRRVAMGFAGLVNGPLDAPTALTDALERARARGYLGAGA